MSLPELLADLETRGVSLALTGDGLTIRGPRDVVPGIVEQVRTHKPELMKALGERVPVGETLPSEVESDTISTAELLRMPLSEFSRSGLVLTVRAASLGGEEIVFAAENAELDPGERRVTYRASELRHLLGLTPAELRSVHRIKRTFRGTVTA